MAYAFPDHYVIAPTIRFLSSNADFGRNALGEIGERVTLGFQYDSATNPHFLTVEETRDFNAQAAY